MTERSSGSREENRNPLNPESSIQRWARPYATYEDSGVEWPEQIPVHWTMRKLKRICTFAYGEALAEAARGEGAVEVHGSNGLIGTHDRANTVGPCLIVGRKGSFGKVNYSASPVFAIDTAFVVDRRRTEVDLRWLFYVLRAARLDAATRDSAIPGLDREDAYTRDVCVCPPEEQRAIAAYLDRETSKIDALVAKKERLIELLTEKRTALITRAVTKGIDPNVPMKDSRVEWLGEIPAHWQVKRLWHLTRSDRPIMYGIVLPGPDVDDGVPVIKGGDISGERLRLGALKRTTREIESAHARSRLRGGDLVYAIRGSIGDVAVVPAELEGANVTQDAARVSLGSLNYERWLMYVLKSAAVFAQLEAGSLGATIRGVNIRDLKRASIPVPPHAEQRAIATYLDSDGARIDWLIATVREAVDRLKELRTALISAAVTGKIDVREEAGG